MQSVWNVLNDPRRVAAICGIAFIALFIAAGPVLQGTAPVAGDSPETIRTYWRDYGDTYLTGDILFGISVLLFFVPFIGALRKVLEPADRSGGMWTQILGAGALAGIILGGAGAFWPAAVALIGVNQLDDSTLQVATTIASYSTTGLGLGLSVMLIAAAVIIAQGKVLWRWLAIFALAAAAANVIGAFWVPAKDAGGVLASISLAGLIGTQVWVLLVSVQMLLPAGRPAQAPGAIPAAR